MIPACDPDYLPAPQIQDVTPILLANYLNDDELNKWKTISKSCHASVVRLIQNCQIQFKANFEVPSLTWYWEPDILPRYIRFSPILFCPFVYLRFKVELENFFLAVSRTSYMELFF